MISSSSGQKKVTICFVYWIDTDIVKISHHSLMGDLNSTFSRVFFFNLGTMHISLTY